MKKRILSLALVLVLLVSALSVTVLAADLPFTDVSANQWYYNDVKNAYENDLINGKTPTTFAPNDNLTYAEAVKLAACMNQRYQTGSVKLENGDPWYQSYVDYCKLNSIISMDYSWNSNATRAGYMEIFANALPSSSLKAINEVPDGSIPDVPMSHPQAAAIYKLYRAGILQGNDAAHNCNPASNIKRSEVAAILTRMMDSSKRIKFSMTAPAEAPLAITKQPVDVGGKEGQFGTVSVEVTGGKTPYTYHWQFDNGKAGWYDIDSSFAEPYQNTLEVSFDTDSPLVNGFRCTVTDAAGAQVVTNTVKLTVEAEAYSPMYFTLQTSETPAVPGSIAELRVRVAGGKASYAYRWETKSGSTWNDLSSYSDASYTDTDTVQIRVGDYTDWTITSPIRCTVTDAAGKTLVSQEMRIISKMTIVTQPQSPAPLQLVNGEDDTVDFGVEIDGGYPPYTYCWKITEQPTNSIFTSSLFGPFEGFPMTETVNSDNHGIRCLVDYWAFYDMYGEGSPASTFEVTCTITDSQGNEITTNPAIVRNS